MYDINQRDIGVSRIFFHQVQILFLGGGGHLRKSRRSYIARLKISLKFDKNAKNFLTVEFRGSHRFLSGIKGSGLR